MDSEPPVKPECREAEEQLWYCIQLDEDSPPVMTRIDDPSVLNDETEKEALIDLAWCSHCRGMWARKHSNPQFIRYLAGDFQNSNSRSQHHRPDSGVGAFDSRRE
jgi:hypothetical protein